MKKIYLDNNATTFVCPEVITTILEELKASPANPSSIHSWGQAAKKRLNSYRQTIANYFSVEPQEVLFTSGGTESMNVLIRGMFSNRISGHAITSSIEHACVYHTLIDLQKRGLDVTFLPPLAHGTISPQAVEEAIRPDTAFVCLFAVNSETGAKNDLEAIAAICQKRKIPLLVDGVASLGKESIKLYPGIAGMGFSGHKIHGPQGSGCVIVRSFLKLSSSHTGALQEYGLRPGTENLPAIAGFATAISLLNTALPEAEHRMRSLRDYLQQELLKISSDFRVHGGDNRICNLLNLSFGKHRGEDLLIALDLAGIAVSHGSACSAGALEPSRVLTQMGVPFAAAKASLRFSLSRYTTKEEIDRTIDLLQSLVF